MINNSQFSLKTMNPIDVNRIIKSYSLENYWKYFLENNKSLNLPYHNITHVMNMIYITEEIYNTCVEDRNENDLRLLFIAIIFHDFNHSGGKLTDKENVKIALDEFVKFNADYNTDYLEYHECSTIIDLIEATQFPHIDSTLLLHQIIRDADLSMCFFNDFYQQCINGLALESGYFSPTIETIENQILWYKNIKNLFNTQYCCNLFDDNQGIIKYLEDIKQYYK